MGKDPALCPNGMDVAKLTQKKVLQILENGVRFGKWVLLENIGEVRAEREYKSSDNQAHARNRLDMDHKTYTSGGSPLFARNSSEVSRDMSEQRGTIQPEKSHVRNPR